MGALAAGVADIHSAQVAVVGAEGGERLVPDDALAGAGADALRARRAGCGRGALGGTDAQLTGAVASTAAGAALAGLGAFGPGVAAAVRGTGSV
jgi:hypothetical protein